MKHLVVILLVGCAATVYGFPDWDVADAKVQGIGFLVTNVAGYLKETIGNGAGEEADARSGQARAILDDVQGRIRGKTLTLDDALEVLPGFLNIMQDLQGDIQDDLANLPASVAEEIQSYTNFIISAIQTNVKSLYATFGFFPGPIVG